MNDEETQRYVRMGLEADVASKARALQSAMNHLKITFEKAAGLYVPSRFNESTEAVKRAIDDFTEAMRRKEAYGSAQRKVDEAQGPEQGASGDVVPVRHEQGDDPSSARIRPHSVDVARRDESYGDAAAT